MMGQQMQPPRGYAPALQPQHSIGASPPYQQMSQQYPGSGAPAGFSQYNNPVAMSEPSVVPSFAQNSFPGFQAPIPAAQQPGSLSDAFATLQLSSAPQAPPPIGSGYQQQQQQVFGLVSSFESGFTSSLLRSGRPEPFITTH